MSNFNAESRVTVKRVASPFFAIAVRNSAQRHISHMTLATPSETLHWSLSSLFVLFVCFFFSLAGEDSFNRTYVTYGYRILCNLVRIRI